VFCPRPSEAYLNGDRDMIHAGQTAGDGRETAATADRLGDAVFHAVAQKGQRVEEVALAGAVPPNEHGQRLERHVAQRDALVAPNAHPSNEWMQGLPVELCPVLLAECGRHAYLPWPNGKAGIDTPGALPTLQGHSTRSGRDSPCLAW